MTDNREGPRGRPWQPGNEGWRHWRVCGAPLRGKPGRTCRCPCVRGRSRCYLHGGAAGAGAPAGNANALKHGRRSAEAVAARKQSVAALRKALYAMTALTYVSLMVGRPPDKPSQLQPEQ